MTKEFTSPTAAGGAGNSTTSGFNITTKIALAFISIGTLAALVTALSSYFLYSGVLENEASAKLGAARTLLQNRVDVEFERISSECAALASSAQLRSGMAGLPGPDAATTDPQIKAVLGSSLTHVGLQNIYLINSKSTLLLAAREDRQQNEIIAAATQLTKQGTKAAIKVCTSKSINDTVILCSTPVASPEGVLVGYVVTQTSAESLFKMLSLSLPRNTGFGLTGEAYLVDQDLAPGSPLRQGCSTQRADSTGDRNALAGTGGPGCS